MDLSHREQLYDFNRRAWNGKYQLTLSSNLDSSLKKNSAFVRKLKAPFQDGEKMANEVKFLSLERYLSEIVDNLIEGFSSTVRASDVYATVEVVSVLHQRFQAPFTVALLARLLICIYDQGTISPDAKAEIIQNKLTVLRRLIRIFTEFYLVGLIPDELFLKNRENPFFLPESAGINSNDLLEQVLTFFLNENIIKHNLSFVTAYCKRFSWVFFEPNSFTSSVIQTRLKDKIFEYTMKAISSCEELDRSLITLSVTIDRTAMRTGRENQRDKSSISDQIDTLRQIRSSLEDLTSMMGLDMPPCNALEANNKTSASGIVLSGSHHSSIFDDESDRQFYEIFPEPQESSYSSHDSLCNSERTIHSSLESRSERMENLLEKLDGCKSATDVDSLAIVYFKEGLHCKASGKHLMRYILATSNQTPVKYYARFLKISQPSLEPIKDEIVASLDKKLRIQLKSARFDLKDIILFCELIKFKLVPTFIVFHKIRTLIISLETKSKYFEILSIIFDTCGTTLTREDEYQSMMDEMVELIHQLRSSGSRSFRLKSQVNDLLMILYPPKALQKGKIVKEAIHSSFLKHLLRVELRRSNLSSIKDMLESMMRMSSECFPTLEQLFTQPEYLPSDSLQLIAELLHDSCPRWFVVSTIDQIMERVSTGLEMNDYKMSHKRLADMRYLGELCNVGIFNDHLVHFVETLLSYVLFYGYSDLTLKSLGNSSWDPSNNYIRILMVTTFLKYCMKDSQSVTQEYPHLDYFLCHFDHYCFNKGPLPQDVRIAVLDVYDILGFKGCLNSEYSLKKLEGVRGSTLKTVYSQEILENEKKQVELNSSFVEDPRIMPEQCGFLEEEQLTNEFEQRFRETIEQRNHDRSLHKTGSPVTLPRVSGASEMPNLARNNSNVRFKILTRKEDNTTSREIHVPHDAMFASEALKFVSERRHEDAKIRNYILSRMKDTSIA